jgi:hypothetical protein
MMKRAGDAGFLKLKEAVMDIFPNSFVLGLRYPAGITGL